MGKRIMLTGVCVSLLLAVAVPMALGQQASLKILDEMATFSEAGVSEKEDSHKL